MEEEHWNHRWTRINTDLRSAFYKDAGNSLKFIDIHSWF